MIGTKTLIKIARKSQQMVTIRRKIEGPRAQQMVTIRRKIEGPRAFRDYNTNSTTKAEKGHFVVYTPDGHRFVFPLGHLKTYIFRELLTMLEEEFRLPSSGPITFPCDASFMKDTTNLIHQCVVLAKERALLQSLVTKSSHPSFYFRQSKAKQATTSCTFLKQN
ncbi:hypothetical protein L1987_58368 [Smallanthus sonchifolius]|uniref:Uncharacterized protein n=1 Tax=Smallanthus sonchifolius TaxID=185202 RepID=A0ACB9DFJ0_9ASTR|nr:hypothetical protein L1987_58368 [Smallanthus sonchifolius]